MRGSRIRNLVRSELLPDDAKLLPKKQRIKIEEWCDQVPVLGFNSGRYDRNLRKEYFVELLADTKRNIGVAKKANTTAFLLTSGFRFLDVINYLGPGVKPMDAPLLNLGFHTNGLHDSPQKFDYPNLSNYQAWYSNILKLSKCRACKQEEKQKWT